MDWLLQIITFPANIFNAVITRSGTTFLWLGGILLVLIFRYFIFPLTGSKADVFSKIHLNNKEKVQEKDK